MTDDFIYTNGFVTWYLPSSNLTGAPTFDGSLNVPNNYTSEFIDMSSLYETPFRDVSGNLIPGNITTNQVISGSRIPSSPYTNAEIVDLRYTITFTRETNCRSINALEFETNSADGILFAYKPRPYRLSTFTGPFTYTAVPSENLERNSIRNPFSILTGTTIRLRTSEDAPACVDTNGWTIIYKIDMIVRYIDCLRPKGPQQNIPNAVNDVCKTYCLNEEGDLPAIEKCESLFYRSTCLTNLAPGNASDAEKERFSLITPVLRNNDNCMDFYETYVSTRRPLGPLDRSLTSYCANLFPNGISDYNNPTVPILPIDKRLCACNLKSSDYINFASELSNTIEDFEPYITNAKCLFIDCADSPYKSIETISNINTGEICDVPDCVNFLDFTVNGTLSGNTNINQITNCVRSFNSTTNSTNGTNGTDTDTPTNTDGDDPIYNKWWFWLSIGVVIIFLIIFIVFLTRSGKKK